MFKILTNSPPYIRITPRMEKLDFVGLKCTKPDAYIDGKGKVIANLFRSTFVISLTDYPKKTKAITGTYYSAWLSRLIDKIKQIRLVEVRVPS